MKRPTQNPTEYHLPEDMAKMIGDHGTSGEIEGGGSWYVHELTTTDALLERWKPNYYVFEKEVRKVQCHQCHRKFETRMMLLRFCSPKCQREKLASFSTVGLG